VEGRPGKKILAGTGPQSRRKGVEIPIAIGYSDATTVLLVTVLANKHHYFL